MADIRTTGFLDTFVRGVPPGPNIEDPLSFGGRWKHLYASAPGHLLKLESNGTTGAVELFEITGGSGQAAIWYQPYSGDVETWAIAAGGTADLREGLRQYLHISNLSDPDAIPVSQYGYRQWTGYFIDSLYGILGSGSTLYAIGAGGIDSGVTVLDSTGFVIDFGGGAGLLRTVGDQVEWWTCQSIAGEPDFDNWTLRLSGTDTSWRSGYIGIGTQQDDDNPSWQGFGGGEILRTQIYRYVSN